MTSAGIPRAFTRLMMARALFSLATQMQSVVLGWQMYQLTKSPLLIGLIGLAEAIPAIGLAPFAGAIVDRGAPDRIFRRLLFGAIVSVAFLAFSQMTSASNVHSHGDMWRFPVWGLFAASAISGVARSFAQPSIYAIVPQIVPRELLATASAWTTTWLQTARVSGPALAGVLLAVTGLYGSVVVIALGLLFAVVAAGRAQLSPLISSRKLGAAEGTSSTKGEILSGIRFVWKHPLMLPALSIDMVCVLFGGVTALLPIYAEEILCVGAVGLGALRAAPALGAASMSLCLTRIDLRAYAGRYFFVAVAGFGLSILAFSISTYFWLSFLALILSGAFDSVSVVVRTSIVQLSSPDHMRGRISAVNSMFIGSSNELGEVESGTLAHFIGVVPTAVFGAMACLAVLATAALRYPALRRLDLREIERVR